MDNIFDLNIPKSKQNCFIYFLIKGNEIVYVGQTSQGLSRPFSHFDKDFDNVGIVYCDVDKLNQMECDYIIKFTPKYNKSVPNASSLLCVRNELRKQTDFKKASVTDIKKIARLLNIKITGLNGVSYLKSEDQYIIINFVKDKKYK